MATLTFKGKLVAEQIEHAASAKTHSPSYAQLVEKFGDRFANGAVPVDEIANFTREVPPALHFVKDQGAYLMSNGSPRLLNGPETASSKVVYAEGLGPECHPQDLCEACGGDDFVETIDLREFSAGDCRHLAAGIFDLEITLNPHMMTVGMCLAEPKRS